MGREKFRDVEELVEEEMGSDEDGGEMDEELLDGDDDNPPSLSSASPDQSPDDRAAQIAHDDLGSIGMNEIALASRIRRTLVSLHSLKKVIDFYSPAIAHSHITASSQ